MESCFGTIKTELVHQACYPVPVQSFGSNSIKALRTRTGSGSENCIPDCGRPVVFVPKFAEVELTFPDPMYEFNTGDGG